MIEWFRQLGRALRNLARIAREQPIWAVTALVTSPVALIRHLFGVVVMFLITGLVLGLGVPLIRPQPGHRRDRLLEHDLHGRRHPASAIYIRPGV